MDWWKHRDVSKSSQADAGLAKFDALLRDVDSQLQNAQADLARQGAVSESFRQRAQEATRLADLRRAQAIAATESGDETMARTALAQQDSWRQQADVAMQSWHDAEAAMQAMTQRVESLRLEQLKWQGEREQIATRMDTAKLDTTLADMKSGLDTRTRELDTLRQTVGQLEAQAAAHREVAELLVDATSEQPMPAPVECEPVPKRTVVDDPFEQLRRQLEAGTSADNSS